jgi:hypothetical protein
MTRHFRALVGFGALLALVLLVSGCASSQAPAPTPDPFAGLADRSDQAFRQGLEAYGQGQYRDALTAFEQAKTLSPTDDQRIDQMLDRTRAAMAPSPTPVPPTPTEVPATPTATPVAMSQQTPDTDLGQRYFGKVSLAMVPGKDSDAPAAAQFFFQDQVGLHVEGLAQHLRLPFTLRVFNSDTGKLVASVKSDDASPTAVATPQAAPTLQAAPASTTDAASPTQTATTQDFKVVRFWDTYVWYHQGGEEPGRYRAELYANGVLTNTFDYTVGTVPVPTPSPEVQPAEPALPAPTDAPTVDDAPPPPPLVSTPVVTAPAPKPAAPVAAPPPPTPTPLPPTPIPTPATAYTTQIGGQPGGLDVNSSTGQFFLADAAGVIWTADAPAGSERPTLGTPIRLQNVGAGRPVDLAADPNTGLMFVSAQDCPSDGKTPQKPLGCLLALNAQSGALVENIPLMGVPADLRLDTDLGLAYVAIPKDQTVVQVDIRGGRQLRTITGMPQVTSLAIDPTRHELYVSHLGGQVTVVDSSSATVTARISATGAGLASVATARGLGYAVNTATHEMAVIDPNTQSVSRYVLPDEPAAVAAAEDTGAVYVLTSRGDFVLQVDPIGGSILGKVIVADRTGHSTLRPGDPVSLRPRLVLDSSDDKLFASLPEAGTLAAVANDSFPVLASEIPYAATSDQLVVAADIPDVLQPGVASGGFVSAQGH